MQRIVFALIGLVLIGAIVVTVMDAGKPPPPEHGGETSDRMSGPTMARMVAGPMKLVEKKDMAGASKAFEALLAGAKAKGGLRAADLIFAYAVTLRDNDRDDESVPYFRRAVAAYRAAAPGSPELAVALANYAGILEGQSPSTPPPDALPTLREALAVREKTLGKANAETARNYVHLGALEGLPVYTGGDPAKVAAAAERIRIGLRLLPSAPNAAPDDADDARLELARLYARNGDVEATFKAAHDFMAANPSYGPYQLRRVAVIFEEAGDAATGRRLRDLYAIPDEKDDEAPTIKNGGALTQDAAPED